MPPFNNFTTKAKEAIKNSHELAIQRGQNHVTPLHLLAALLSQDESIVISILDKLDVDTVLLTDSLLESIESPESGTLMSPSYQIYLTPELAGALESSQRVAQELKDEFISTEHLFIALIEVSPQARTLLARFKIEKEQVVSVLEELRNQGGIDVNMPKKRGLLPNTQET